MTKKLSCVTFHLINYVTPPPPASPKRLPPKTQSNSPSQYFSISVNWKRRWRLSRRRGRRRMGRRRSRRRMGRVTGTRVGLCLPPPQATRGIEAISRESFPGAADHVWSAHCFYIGTHMNQSCLMSIHWLNCEYLLILWWFEEVLDWGPVTHKLDYRLIWKPCVYKSESSPMLLMSIGLAQPVKNLISSEKVVKVVNAK